MVYILFYDVVDNYVEKRAPYREAHLKHATASHQCRELLLGGALADPADTAVIVFSGQAEAEAFAKADPYVLNGLVKSWRVRPWNVVIGAEALK